MTLMVDKDILRTSNIEYRLTAMQAGRVPVNITLLLPELFQLLMVAVLFVQSIVQKDGALQLKRWLPWAAALGVMVCFGSLAQNGLLFSGTYRLDNLSQFFKMTVSSGFSWR